MSEENVENQNVIRVKGLKKDFGKTQALNGLDLEVKKGEVHGFLGPNGAGKSTTIRILLGLLRKNGGEAEILGGDPWKDSVKLHRRLAYVPGDVNLWPNLSGGEAIDLFGKLRGGLDKQRRAQLLKDFDLDPRKKCRTYSKGNRQKVALVAALASNVELFILDEPTSGLDPLMEATFQDYIKELKKAGKTVLLSSHILAEAEALCDRVTIIRDGKDVQTGTLAELRHLTRPTVKVDTRKPLSDLSALEGVHHLQIRGKHAEFEVEHNAMDIVISKLSQAGIEHLISQPASLESLFLQHYDDKLPENGKVKEQV